MKNKYDFLKKIYKDFVIIFESDGKWKSISWDKILIDDVKKGDINYIVVDNDFNIKEYRVDNNQYHKYLIRAFLENCLERLLDEG